MKLILDNGREFELIRIQRMEFILEQEEPYPMPHILSRPAIGAKGEDEYSAPLYKYKAFIIGGQLYAYKEVGEKK